MEGSSNGGTSWSEIFNYDLNGGGQVPITQTESAPVLANTSNAKVRIRISGSTSADLDKIQVDDVKVDAP